MRVLAISGSGQGAGKTTLARTLSPTVWSIADGIRHELSKIYPKIQWENRTQAYKDGTKVPGTNRSVRQMLIDHGQQACIDNPTYWVSEMTTKLLELNRMWTAGAVVAIDDVRKLCELEHLRAKFPDVVHFHVNGEPCVDEPMYDNIELADIADYVVEW